jgi:hypothetical protein
MRKVTTQRKAREDFPLPTRQKKLFSFFPPCAPLMSKERKKKLDEKAKLLIMEVKIYEQPETFFLLHPHTSIQSLIKRLTV